MLASSLAVEAEQNHAQAHIALLKIGHGGQDLLVGGMVAGSLELLGKLGQFPGMGTIVIHHVLNQCLQLLHGGMLKVAAAGAAVGSAVVVIMVVMIVVVMMMVMIVMVVIMMVMMLVIDVHIEYLQIGRAHV